jgi:hypothetical protein
MKSCFVCCCCIACGAPISAPPNRLI